MAMAMTKSILTALAFATGVFAAECSTSGTTTITASADVTALASCSTYSGSVAIQTGLSTPNGRQQIQIDNLRKIAGNLTATGIDELSSIVFGSLQSCDGITLAYLSGLASLVMPQLTTVKQLNFTALPNLQSLSFGNVGITKANSILVTNTGLNTLDGLNNLEGVDTLNINNNQALQNITLKFTSIKNSLIIDSNGYLSSVLAVDFPKLETAQNMTFRNCSAIQLPALANVTDDLGFYGNEFTSFAAPNLTTAGGLVFVDNTELTNISLPALTSINGTYLIANNTKLTKIDGFQKLSLVTGALDFSGNFTQVDLPALKQVRGAFNVQTSGQFDCTQFNKLRDDKSVKGKYVCTGNQNKPGTAGSVPSTDSKPGAAIQFKANIPFIVVGSSVITMLLQMFL